MAEGTASRVPREAFQPGDLAFPPDLCPPARAPRPPVFTLRKHSTGKILPSFSLVDFWSAGRAKGRARRRPERPKHLWRQRRRPVGAPVRVPGGPSVLCLRRRGQSWHVSGSNWGRGRAAAGLEALKPLVDGQGPPPTPQARPPAKKQRPFLCASRESADRGPVTPGPRDDRGIGGKHGHLQSPGPEAGAPTALDSARFPIHAPCSPHASAVASEPPL